MKINPVHLERYFSRITSVTCSTYDVPIRLEMRNERICGQDFSPRKTRAKKQRTNMKDATEKWQRG